MLTTDSNEAIPFGYSKETISCREGSIHGKKRIHTGAREQIRGIRRLKMAIKFFISGVLHFLSGVLLFRKGTGCWWKAERHFVLTRYYMSRPEGEWRGSFKRTGIVLRGKILEWNDRRLRIIDQKETERMEKLRKEYELIPCLFESKWRELNLPLCLTYPGETRYDGAEF